MRSAAQADLAKYERALNRFYQIPASQRNTRDREKILKVLGVENPQEFLSMHIRITSYNVCYTKLLRRAGSVIIWCFLGAQRKRPGPGPNRQDGRESQPISANS